MLASPFACREVQKAIPVRGAHGANIHLVQDCKFEVRDDGSYGYVALVRYSGPYLPEVIRDILASLESSYALDETLKTGCGNVYVDLQSNQEAFGMGMELIVSHITIPKNVFPVEQMDDADEDDEDDEDNKNESEMEGEEAEQ